MHSRPDVVELRHRWAGGGLGSLSRLGWFSAGPVEVSAAAVKNEVEELGFVRGLGRTAWICRCFRPSGAGSWPRWVVGWLVEPWSVGIRSC